jgi:hypothetical protein
MQKSLTLCKAKRLLVAAVLFCSWVAQAQAPEIGGMIELRGFLNARMANEKGTVDFRKEANDFKKYVLAAGSRGQITAFTKLASGNYGIKVKLLNVDGVQEEVWVYYQPNQKNPDMSLYSIKEAKDIRGFTDDSLKVKVAHVYDKKAVRNPSEATHLRLNRELGALGSGTYNLNGKSDRVNSLDPAFGTNDSMDSIIKKVADSNIAVKAAGNPAAKAAEVKTYCKECSAVVPSSITNPSCNSQNDYIQKVIAKNNSPMLDVLTSRTPPTKLWACIQTQMENKWVKSNASYISCENGKEKKVPQACLSADYKKIVANAFDLVTDCTSGLVSPTATKALQDHAKSVIFSIISGESRFHINANLPHGNDVGLGQFTPSGIKAVNGLGDYSYNFFAEMKKSIQSDSNPKTSCQMLKNIELNQIDPRNHRCRSASIEDNNPVLAMVYTEALFKANRMDFENAVNRNHGYARSIFKSLSPDVQEKVRNYTAAWSHNNPYANSTVLAYMETQRGHDLLRSKRAGDVERFFINAENSYLTSRRDLPKQSRRPYIADLIDRQLKESQPCIN